MGASLAPNLGQMCDRAVQKDGLGFQIFNAVNDGITNYENTAHFSGFSTYDRNMDCLYSSGATMRPMRKI
jgi:hypothetical protein